MKKLAAISLLAVLLFNWCGYRWVVNYLQQKADQHLVAQLDNNNYNEEELIELKVPLELPYQTDWKDFERVDGDIEIDGVHYKYVKRKVQDGQLILKCIPNTTKQDLLSARDQFFKLVNDLEQDQPASKESSKNAPVVKNSLSEYETIQSTFIGAQIPVLINVDYNLFQNTLHTCWLHQSPEQPPETIA